MTLDTNFWRMVLSKSISETILVLMI